MSTQPSASNYSIPATFSGQNLPPPPPGFPPRQNYILNDEDPIQAVSENEMSPEQRHEGPVMMSNEDILSMLNMMKRQMDMQHQRHQTLMKEIEGMRSEIRRPP